MGLACALAIAGCSSLTIEAFEAPWAAGDFPAAEEAIDRLIAAESDAPLETVKESHGLALDVRADRDDTYLLLLEKGMCRLAFGDFDHAIDVWRRARDVLDSKLAANDLGGYFGAALGDDRAIDYVGADYEHVLVRTLIALADLMNGGEDAFAYAFQISEKQEEIAGLGFGDAYDERGNYIGYDPRESFERVPIGKYLEGVILESQRSFDEGAKAFRSAAALAAAASGEQSGGAQLAREGVLRCEGELRGGEGTGSVHVFYLAGRGPALAETTSPITDTALFLAQIGAIFGAFDLGVIAQAPVPVPVVVARENFVPQLEVRLDDGVFATQPLLDVTHIAAQQLEANLPWIIARAAVRRTLKGTVSAVATDHLVQDDGLALFLNLLANLFWTATEHADTRNWTSLPAQFQALHLYLPEGEHALDLGRGMLAPVRVRAGYSSFVLVLQPNLSLPGAVLVDVHSQVPAEPLPPPVP